MGFRHRAFTASARAIPLRRWGRFFPPAAGIRTISTVAMTPFGNRPWTVEDGERLKSLVASGVSAARAASIFRCSLASIRKRAWKLGAPFPSVREARKRNAIRCAEAEAALSAHEAQEKLLSKTPRGGQ